MVYKRSKCNKRRTRKTNKTRKTRKTRKTKRKRTNKKNFQIGGTITDAIQEYEIKKLRDFLEITPENTPVCLFAFSHHSEYFKSELPIVPEGFTLLNFVNSGKYDISWIPNNLSVDTSMIGRAMEYGKKVQKAYQSGEIIDQYGCLTDNGLLLKQNLMDSEFTPTKDFKWDKYYKAHLYLKEYHSGKTFNDVVLITPNKGKLFLFNGYTPIEIEAELFDTHFFGETFYDKKGNIIFSRLMEKVKKMIDLLSPDFLRQHEAIFCHATCRNIPEKFQGSEGLVRNVSKKSVFSDEKLIDSSLFCFLREATPEQRGRILRLFGEKKLSFLLQ